MITIYFKHVYNILILFVHGSFIKSLTIYDEYFRYSQMTWTAKRTGTFRTS